MCKAIEVASWFINNDYIPSNTKSGNLKLNKLLYFAQLISLVKRQKPLFKDELYAFENGVVVEDVRKEYYENCYCNIRRFASAKRKRWWCTDLDNSYIRSK